jgi:hypothetical protein
MALRELLLPDDGLAHPTVAPVRQTPTASLVNEELADLHQRPQIGRHHLIQQRQKR